MSNFRNGFSSEQMIPDSSIEGSAALTGTNTLVNGQYLYKIDAFPVMSPSKFQIRKLGGVETYNVNYEL